MANPRAVLPYDRPVSSETAPTDFIRQMYLAIIEESPLWSLAAGATDYLGGGQTIKHGPWSPDECSTLLLRWFATSWLELYLPEVPTGWRLRPAEWQMRVERRGPFAVLATEDAHQLLLAPARWLADTADGQACLSRTDSGMEHEATDWYAAAVPG